MASDCPCLRRKWRCTVPALPAMESTSEHIKQYQRGRCIMSLLPAEVTAAGAACCATVDTVRVRYPNWTFWCVNSSTPYAG